MQPTLNEESKTPQEASNKTKNLVNSALGIGVSLALLFGMVYVISKAWKSGQKTA